MAKSQSWFRAERTGNVADIAIFSEIGGNGVTVQDFSGSLRALGRTKEIRLAIASDGGDVSVGFAIFNILDRHPARKVVTVEGLAASMASVIAMVGDEIVMPANAMLMIHNPWGGVVGSGDQIQSFGGALLKMRESIIGIYAARTGQSDARIGAMMDRETWMTAKEAVDLGFADRVEGDSARLEGRFNVARFRNAPASLRGGISSASIWSKFNARP